MLFFEPVFFAFFAIYFALHVLLPAQLRIYLVIVGSLIFYSWWRLDYVVLPLALTLIAASGLSWAQASKTQRARRTRFALTIAFVLLPLVVVKYGYFIASNIINPWLDLSGIFNAERLKWPLPLGISFMTFTLIAYVVDVFRGRYSVEPRFSTVLGYVLFFPHLIAGPILRPHELMPQLKQMRRALDARFSLGTAIFTLGLVKKLVFADQISAAVDQVYGVAGVQSAWLYLLAIYGFSVQIYCDFSGYTDMAIGLAYLLRIRLPTNFRRPYVSGSIIEFWRRWHISLSHWLRDYLYISMGGNRDGKWFQLRNILITMILGGLWHGANWTFAAWGLLHGVALGANHLLRRTASWGRLPIPKWLATITCFHLVTFGWIYFRAPDLSTAHRIISGIVEASWSDGPAVLRNQAFAVTLLLVFMLSHRFDRHGLLRLATARLSPALIWPVIIACWALAIAVSQGSSAKFIYFDF